jgi:outer membrane immunogenic protein
VSRPASSADPSHAGRACVDHATSAGLGSAAGTFKDVKAGWTAGAGLESAWGGGWSVKLEYLYIDLGDTEQTLATPALGTILTDTRRTTDNIVRLGLNYRWGGGGYGGGYGAGY